MRGIIIMQAATIRELKAGEFFKRKPDANKVYTRAEYCRDAKKYQCDDHSDIWGNGLLLKGSTIVYIGFTY